VLALCLAAPLASAQDRKDAAESNLERLEREQEAKEKQRLALEEAAKEAAEEAQELSEDLVAAARNIRMSEEEALRLEDRIKDLEAETTAKKDQLDARRGELLKRCPRCSACPKGLSPSRLCSPVRPSRRHAPRP